MSSELQRKEQITKELQQFDNDLIYSKIEELGQRNLTELLQTMPYNKDNDFHDLSVAVCRANPISNEDLSPLGPSAHKNFGVIPEAWNKHTDMMSFLAGEISHSGANFTIVTNHSNVIDIALVLGGLRLQIKKYLEVYGLDEYTFSDKTGIVISRGITTTQVALSGLNMAIPTVEAIQLFTNVFFTFPTTTSVRSKNFPSKLVRLSNELTKLEIDKFRSQGGSILAIAPSASKDLIWREGVHMQPLKDGTMDMMKGWVIPVAITLDGNEPACEVLKWRYVNDHKDCHDTMRDIAKACHRQSLTPHHYYDKHSLFEEAKQGLSRFRKE